MTQKSWKNRYTGPTEQNREDVNLHILHVWALAKVLSQEKDLFNKWVWGYLDIPTQKNETRLDPYISPVSKTKLKCIKDSHVRPKTIRVKQAKCFRTLEWAKISFFLFFFAFDKMPKDPQSTGNKIKTRQMELHEGKKLHTAKGTIISEETTYRMEKIICKLCTWQGLLSRIHKELRKLIAKEKRIVFKWATHLVDISQKKIQK